MFCSDFVADLEFCRECLDLIGCVCEGDSIYCNDLRVIQYFAMTVLMIRCRAVTVRLIQRLAQDSIFSKIICHEIQYQRKFYDVWIQLSSVLQTAIQYYRNSIITGLTVSQKCLILKEYSLHVH